MSDPRMTALVSVRSVDCGVCDFVSESMPFVGACIVLSEHTMTCHPREYAALFPDAHIEHDLSEVRLFRSRMEASKK